MILTTNTKIILIVAGLVIIFSLLLFFSILKASADPKDKKALDETDNKLITNEPKLMKRFFPYGVNTVEQVVSQLRKHTNSGVVYLLIQGKDNQLSSWILAYISSSGTSIDERLMKRFADHKIKYVSKLDNDYYIKIEIKDNKNDKDNL